MTAKIVPFGLSRPHAEQLIHQLAKNDAFIIEPVCKVKIRERDFTMRQVLKTMREGSINQGPGRDECGDWRCRIKKRVAGRTVRVVVAIHDLRMLYVISVH